MDVDPVVREEILAVDDERNGEKVAVPQATGGFAHLGRRCGARELDDGAQRQRRDHRVRERVRHAAGLDLDDAVTGQLQPLHRGAGAHVAAVLDDRRAHRLPHLPRAEARIVELRDQALHLVSLVAEERRPGSGEEGEALDPLGGPFGADLRGRHAPELLGVRLEEELEQAPSEAIRDPVLEGVVDLVPARRSAEVRGHAAGELDRAELPDHVGPAQRIVEVALVPVDARHAWTQQELVAEHLVPQRVDLDRFREEAMAAQIEAVAVDLDGLGQPSHLLLGLQHDRIGPGLAELIRRGEAGGPAAEDERRLRILGRHRQKGGRARGTLADAPIHVRLQRLEVVDLERDLVAHEMAHEP